MSGEVISGEGGIFAADLNDGSLSARIVNKVGKELPGTGGQGTLLIYLIGILSSAAGILLFYLKKSAAKRQKNENIAEDRRSPAQYAQEKAGRGFFY